MPEELRVAAPPSKPLLVFDGECRFCRRWVTRWRRSVGDAVEYAPYQEPAVAARFPEISRENFEQSLHLILPDGSVLRGAEAVFRSLHEGGRERWLLRLYNRSDGFAELSELLYEEVAGHRQFLSFLDRVYSGPGVAPLSYVRTRFVFLRGLALVYLVAFGSLAGQIQGLAGSRGIAPVHDLMAAVKARNDAAHIGWIRHYFTPTLAWWDESDRALDWQCRAGIGLALLLLLGIAPAPVLFLLWCLYLSLTSVCPPFLDFQWDNLLLETGFLAVFFAPLQWVERPSRQAEPSALMIWLLRWLVFRLMFESGAVKLMSTDAAWWNLSALRFHFETQPLPTWPAWHVHLLAPVVLRALTVAVFVIELVVPALIVAGRKPRLLAAGLFALLQAAIMITGNYGFFNWLALLLCLPLLDDRFLARGRTAPESDPGPGPEARRTRWPRRVTVPLTLVVVPVTLIGLLGSMRAQQRWPAPVVAIYAWLEPLRTFNSYGLFAVMTQTRPEIVIEGSDDGEHWLPYEFKYKPGDLSRRPGFVAPFQPRLDWQMWFAALGRARENPWFLNFEARLLEGSPPVLALLGHNPFPNAPPKRIRAQLYLYHFSNDATRKASGQWWTRELVGSYFPPIGFAEKSRR